MRSAPIRILVLEDDPHMSEFIQLRVERIVAGAFPNAFVIPATTMKQAEALLGLPYKFDVILLDLVLPDSEIENSIAKAEAFNEHTPVIIVTGRYWDDVRKLLRTKSIPVLEKSSGSFMDGIARIISDAIRARRDRESGERLTRIDEILARFNSISDAHPA